MGKEEHAEVLVVGAGPVGMTTALMLAEHGVKATVIDAARGTAAHSYACALHPRSLELLDRFGLLDEILQWGRRIHRIAFYEGASRRAEVRLSDLPGKVPFGVVLPQNALEWLLERTLNRRAGLQVRWGERFTDLRRNGDAVTATVEELAPSGPATTPAPAEAAVRRSKQIQTPFLVGADGHGSAVRRSLDLEYERIGDSELFMIFEFETGTEPEDEVRVVLDQSTTSVLWPISSNRSRWGFQVAGPEPTAGFPAKIREPGSNPAPFDVERAGQQLRELIQQRAPWFGTQVGNLTWVKQVQFERRLTSSFREGRCCLVGDAAHQTGPVGVQSFNIGLREADELVGALGGFLNDSPNSAGEESWELRWRRKWRRILGQKGAPHGVGEADEWVQRHAARMLSCFPASGSDLTQLLAQLRLRLP